MIEGIDEDADLVVGLNVDLIVKIALGDGLGRFGQLLNGDSDASGEVKTKPNSAENDEESKEEKENDVVRFDGILEDFNLLVFIEGGGNPL